MPGIFRPAILKSARFESAILSSAILPLPAPIVSSIISTLRSARFSGTLRRSVFRRRQIAPARSGTRTPTAPASTAASESPAAPSAGILSTILAAAILTAAIAATAKILSGAICPSSRRIIRRFIIRPEILRRGRIRFRLPFVRVRLRVLRAVLVHIARLPFFHVLVFAESRLRI